MLRVPDDEVRRSVYELAPLLDVASEDAPAAVGVAAQTPAAAEPEPEPAPSPPRPGSA